MPDSASVAAVQLATNCVRVVVVPPASVRLPAAVGGVLSTAWMPSVVTALPVSPAPLMAATLT